MLLSSVMIVSREVFEAVFIICLLISLAHIQKRNNRWLIAGAILGVVGAAAFAYGLRYVTMLWDYKGQELLVGSLYLVMFLLLYLLNTQYLVSARKLEPRAHSVLFFLTLFLLGFAMIRELGEIIIYLSAFFQSKDQLRPALLGSLLGAGIGCSAGVIIFYILARLPDTRSLTIMHYCFALIGGGLLLKVTKFLVQIDLIPLTEPVWNSSGLLSEQSITGHILSALLSYESQPTTIDLLAYGLGTLLILGAPWLRNQWRAPGGHPPEK